MKRVITSLFLVPFALSVILLAGKWGVLAVVALVASICFHEYRGIAAAYHGGRFGVWSFGAGVAFLAVPREAWLLVTALALVAVAVEARAVDLSQTLPRAAALLLGIVYIFGPWKCALQLHAASPYWLLYALAVSWTGDISAYYSGRSFGRHKLAPRVSPAKSWEGAAASLVASVGFGFFFMGQFLPQVPGAERLALSAVANVAGQVGDLAESALKRGAGLKDSGSILPGHGGLLDRLDSSLFSLPAVYLYLQVVESAGRR